MTDNKRAEVYLAALLHDIGKFYQRADNLIGEVIKDNQHLKALAEMVCPINDTGSFGYQHAFWTCKFFEDHADKTFNQIRENGKELFRVNKYNGRNDDNLPNLAAFHHKPQTKLQAMVQLADWWSSGMERIPDRLEKDEAPDFGKFRYKKVPMFSPFNKVHNGNFSSAYSFVPLSLSEQCMPNPEILKTDFKNTDKKAFEEKYISLWKGFNERLIELPQDSYRGFAESLLFLLKNYTWTIPASTNDMADVSLYEHLKTTAAIADCFYQYEKEFPGSFVWEKGVRKPNFSKGNYPLMLCCWDLSGIQDFLYNIAGSKASVSLKGRSFFLQLLVETIIQKTLNACDIQLGNVIYSSGGKLFILLPNTEKNIAKLNELHVEFEKNLWQEHKGKIYLCLGLQGFSFDSSKRIILFPDGSEGDFSILWKKVIDHAASGKFRKYKSFIDDSFESFFEPDGSWEKGEKYQLCAVTGEEGIKNQTLVNLNPKAESEEEKVWVLKTVKEQAELGNSLKDADYILTYLGKDEQGSNFLSKRATCNIDVAKSGIFHYLFDQQQLAFDDAEFRKISSVDVARVRGINLPEFYNYARLKGTGCSYGYLFYGGNKQASISNENKTFEQLCYVEQKNSESFLGILRMDVDGLGRIFAEGIPEEKRSFAAYSTFSAQLDWFFSGYLNTIRNSDLFRDHVNIIYSGGDDVFAVGRWDKIIDFAEKIREEFRRFTGREDISISGGVTIVNAKFPIRLGASMAGTAEDKAKSFDNEKKNALCLFGEVAGWENEWPEVKALKEELIKLMTMQGGLSKAFLHQLIRWKVQKDDKKSISFRWHTAYYLKRYSKNYEHKPAIAAFLENIRAALFTGQGQFSTNRQKHTSLRYYDLAAIAARWAEMEIKEIF